MSADRRQAAVMAIGVFDGVHKGHRELLRAACEEARMRSVPCVAVTFAPDPAEVLATPVPNTRLLGTKDRVAALKAAGADEVRVLDFTQALAQRSPARFVRESLYDLHTPVSVHVGENFRFGRGGAGTTATLTELGHACGFDVHVHGLVAAHGSPISSTRIRTLLAAGELEEANSLLMRSHLIRGRVEHGRGEGTSFGFPTANVRSDAMDCLPCEGVYACYVICGDGVWPAAANVGAPPSFSSPEPAFLEANLIGFEGDLYGEEVVVTFERWLRASRVFGSLEELEDTVLNNISWVRKNLRGRPAQLF